MDEQRERIRSCDPAERLAAALLISGELSRRLRLLGNAEIAQLLDDEVCANLSILAPEVTVCVEAALRLGLKHERDHLATLGTFADVTAASLDEHVKKTKDAIEERVPVLYQPAFQ